jgi:hypothetical protein
MAGTVRLVAPTMGGEADTYAELDVTLPCSAKPVLVTSTFPAILVVDEETGETLGLTPKGRKGEPEAVAAV